MTKSSLSQCSDGNRKPYVTVGTDQRGSACWVVVGNGIMIECATGERALSELNAMLVSGGFSAGR